MTYLAVPPMKGAKSLTVRPGRTSANRIVAVDALLQSLGFSSEELLTFHVAYIFSPHMGKQDKNALFSFCLLIIIDLHTKICKYIWCLGSIS